MTRTSAVEHLHPVPSPAEWPPESVPSVEPDAGGAPVAGEPAVTDRTVSDGAVGRGTVDRRMVYAAAAVTTVGVLVALFAGYLFGFTAVQQSRAQLRLLDNFHGPAGLAALTGRIPAEGRPVALIEIPTLNLQQVVVEGTSAPDLTNGPGLMPGSALPGVPGDTVIAGRRRLFGGPFGGIDTLRPGARITVTGGYGTFGYRVVRIAHIDLGHAHAVIPTLNPGLTLVTSDGSLAPTGQIVVVARMVGAPVDVASAPTSRPSISERMLSGDTGALWPTVLWGVALLVALALTVFIQRRWRRTWPLYLMSVPVLLALAVLCFQSFAVLLPATQ